jgi:hypothetical protein
MREGMVGLGDASGLHTTTPTTGDVMSHLAHELELAWAANLDVELLVREAGEDGPVELFHRSAGLE